MFYFLGSIIYYDSGNVCKPSKVIVYACLQNWLSVKYIMYNKYIKVFEEVVQWEKKEFYFIKTNQCFCVKNKYLQLLLLKRCLVMQC